MNTDKIDAIREARRALLAEGEPDTMDNVIARLGGGSKTTMTKYWSITNPRDESPVQAAVTTSAPAPELEQAFRETFTAFVESNMRFMATQGIVGNETSKLMLSRKAPHLPLRKTEYHLSRSHPLVEELEEDAAEKYLAHLDVWEQMQAHLAPAPAPKPVAAPATPPPPLTLENLRLYYTNRHTSPWPNGVALPLEVYPLLTALWNECDTEMAAAERKQRALTNAMGQQPRGSVDEGPLRAVEARRSTMGMMCQSIESDRDRLRLRAHNEGRILE